MADMYQPGAQLGPYDVVCFCGVIHRLTLDDFAGGARGATGFMCNRCDLDVVALLSNGGAGVARLECDLPTRRIREAIDSLLLVWHKHAHAAPLEPVELARVLERSTRIGDFIAQRLTSYVRDFEVRDPMPSTIERVKKLIAWSPPKPEPIAIPDVTKTIDDLRAQLAEARARVAQLEAERYPQSPPAEPKGGSLACDHAGLRGGTMFRPSGDLGDGRTRYTCAGCNASVVVRDGLEPRADLCNAVFRWHSRAERPRPAMGLTPSQGSALAALEPGTFLACSSESGHTGKHYHRETGFAWTDREAVEAAEKGR